jgi:glycosyltransferase involved in cell wall biosynthesis
VPDDTEGQPRVNVLYLTLNPNRQSTTVPTEGWFRFLAGSGLRPVLVSREAGAFQAWAGGLGVPCYLDLLPFPEKTSPVGFVRSAWRLWRIGRRHRIDLLHCNEHDVYPVGRFVGRLLGVPVVVSVHFEMEKGFCHWAFTGWKAPDMILFVSRRLLEACATGLEGVVPRNRWQVLHNGLDLSRYVPDVRLRAAFRSEYGIAPDAPVIGVACALRTRKQLEHLFEAADRLSDSRVRVLLAGFPVADEAEYGASLIRDARARLGDRLIFVGELTDMRGFSNALDLFINTSRHESFGIGVLEALACGCPVVGYDSKAVDEVVLPDGGEIVEQDDRAALLDVIVRWLNDPGLRTTRRAAARRQAEHFDLRRLSSELWALYQRLRPDVV